MTVFLERNGTRVDCPVETSAQDSNHVDEDEDGLELGYLGDRRTRGCRGILLGNSRRAGANERSHRGSDATEPWSGRARKSATSRPGEPRPHHTRATSSDCVPSASGWAEPGREAPAATNRGSGADNARRRQDVRRKPTERPEGIASSGLLPRTLGWNFRAADACCHSPFSGQHWRQEHWLFDCGGGQSVGQSVLNAAIPPTEAKRRDGIRTFSMYGR
jgi:hypothetical protein